MYPVQQKSMTLEGIIAAKYNFLANPVTCVRDL